MTYCLILAPSWSYACLKNRGTICSLQKCTFFKYKNRFLSLFYQWLHLSNHANHSSSVSHIPSSVNTIKETEKLLTLSLSEASFDQRRPQVTSDDPSLRPLMDVVTDISFVVPARKSSYCRFPQWVFALGWRNLMNANYVPCFDFEQRFIKDNIHLSNGSRDLIWVRAFKTFPQQNRKNVIR